MSSSDLAIVAALIFVWATLSARLERFDVTAPIVFVLAGLLLTHGPLATLGIAPSHELVKALAEITLVLVLFSDASRVGLRDLRADMWLCVRLLVIGLPLTIGLGTLLAWAVVGGASVWLALLVGAALAPTDAALGAGMMVNAAVPARIRRLINVESGLNDGIATPFVLIALAGVESSGHAGTIRINVRLSTAYATSGHVKLSNAGTTMTAPNASHTNSDTRALVSSTNGTSRSPRWPPVVLNARPPVNAAMKPLPWRASAQA